MTNVDIKNMVWKPTIVSDCALRSFIFDTRIPEINENIVFFFMQLVRGTQNLSKNPQ